jgi:uncharacterized protein involved in copper resistance
MKHYVRTLACVVTLLVAGCGGKQTVASKSAAAFDAAGGHVAPTAEPPAATATSEHAAMPGMDHSTMPAMDHTKMPGMEHAKMAGMDHTKMPGMDHTKMPGMDHTKMPGMDHTKMPGMDHTKMLAMDHSTMPGMQHGSSTNAPTVIAPPITQPQPATLRPDAFDAPAPSSVEEAARAHHGHGGMS